MQLAHVHSATLIG